MTQSRTSDFHAYVDQEAGVVDRSIFSDPEIYAEEMRRIFARAWNFMCHESQIPNGGDFFTSYIGEERVIVVRDKTGAVQVLLNTCRHRGNAVCRAELGNTKSFLCTYHGWTYDLDGKLIGVPGQKELYSPDFDRSQWALVKAAKVESYKGFVFATMDADAPELAEFLGPVGRLALDSIVARGPVSAIDGVQKNRIACNWKMAVDNVFDWYHVEVTHASAMMTSFANAKPPPPDVPRLPPEARKLHRVVFGEYGHAISGPRLQPADWRMLQEHHPRMPDVNAYTDHAWRGRPDVAEALGEVGATTLGHPHIFPNLWITSGGRQLSLRIPKGPDACEIWWFTLQNDDIDPDVQEAQRRDVMGRFGPAGVLEQDDGENWDQSTRATLGEVSRRHPFNYQMNLGRGRIEQRDGFAFVDAGVNEHAQLWTWINWADWMNAGSWPALKQAHAPVPAGVV